MFDRIISIPNWGIPELSSSFCSISSSAVPVVNVMSADLLLQAADMSLIFHLCSVAAGENNENIWKYRAKVTNKRLVKGPQKVEDVYY